jgi:hypothetical protein
MRRLFFGQLLVLFTFSSLAQGAGIGQKLELAIQELGPGRCVEQLKQGEDFLESLGHLDHKKEISQAGHDKILNELWQAKIRVHDKLVEMYQTGALVKECADASRGFLRAVRTVEDHVAEDQYRNRNESMSFPSNAFAAGNLQVKRHPKFANFDMVKDLKSGDVLLTRGNAYTSAAIASLGEFDTQFSHMSMVYRDPKGEVWTVEAHIEVGSFVRTLQDHIDDKNYRTMLFRYQDEEQAALAAEYIFNKVKLASDTTGNIFYDFGFDQDDNSELFCSEVVSYALAHVSRGEIQIPMFRSQLLSRKPEFVRMLGITAADSFVPADIEVDPRFKMIAEWRDPARTIDNLQKDAVLHAMYEWNDAYGYQMVQGSSSKAFLYRNVAWPLRRVPVLKKYFKDKMPINMSRQLIGYFGVLESTGELLQKELKRQEQEALLERGYPLLRQEKREVLEHFRLQDLHSKKRPLHKMYRPRGKS